MNVNNNKQDLIFYGGLTSLLIGTILLFNKRESLKKQYKFDKDNKLDPAGSTNLFKYYITNLMALIAYNKETKKSEVNTIQKLIDLESWHHAEDHDFFNESHYYNGCDYDNNNDRFVSRISRRGRLGKMHYVFLLLEIDGFGVLQLEEDEVPTTTNEQYSSPSTCGLTYICEEPLKRWKIIYDDKLIKGNFHPLDKDNKYKNSEKYRVKFELTYTADTPLFWYMRDDHSSCLAKNLAQEPWNYNFFKTCINRTSNHGHYEDYGRAIGTLKVYDDNNKEIVSKNYNYGTFRDHSWDIRRWGTMDHLFILLLALDKPLIINNKEFYYIDLTLVSMPGNITGVAKYATGYLADKNGKNGRILPLSKATSIDDIKWKYDPNNKDVRVPLDEHLITMYFYDSDNDKEYEVSCKCDGPIKTVCYWPDKGAFKVYEDNLNFTIKNETEKNSGDGLVAYGTRQSGFRVGDFDPSLGGCG